MILHVGIRVTKVGDQSTTMRGEFVSWLPDEFMLDLIRVAIGLVAIYLVRVSPAKLLHSEYVGAYWVESTYN